jgi:hypothetical protein
MGAQVKSMWDLWWTNWHWDRFFSELSVFPCQFHSNGAPLIVKLGKKKTVHHLHWGCTKCLKDVVRGPFVKKNSSRVGRCSLSHRTSARYQHFTCSNGRLYSDSLLLRVWHLSPWTNFSSYLTVNTVITILHIVYTVTFVPSLSSILPRASFTLTENKLAHVSRGPPQAIFDV